MQAIVLDQDLDGAERMLAGRNNTVTLPSLIFLPSGIAWVALAKSGPQQIAMMSSISHVANTFAWPGQAGSEWSCMISEHSTERIAFV